MGVQVAMLMGDTAERSRAALELIAQAQAANIQKISDWYTLKRIIQTGAGKQYFPIGTQLTEAWKESADGTEYQAPWDVMHHYANGDMALAWHWTHPTGVPFDQPEAIYYAPADGLAAGQYYIPIGFNYGDGWKAGHNINFTLSEAMDAGDQLVLSTATNAANDPTNGMTWNVYAKGSTESKQSGVTSDSDTGTALDGTSTTGAGYTNGQTNAPQRVVYGYNRWAQSAIRQWLNSAAAAGAWWTAQNAWDRPPAVAATLRGFLAGYGADFLETIQPVAVVTARNTVEGAEEATETTYDKIFLPSLTQMYVNQQYQEDEPWDYYVELAKEIGLTGRFGTGGSNVYEVLKKYPINNQTVSVHSWLRSAHRGYAYSAWSVASAGGVSNYGAGPAGRGCPACIIQASA